MAFQGPVNRYTSDILLTLNPRIWAIFVSAKSDPVCHQLLRAPCTDSFENSSLRGVVLFLLPEGSVFDEIVFWSFALRKSTTRRKFLIQKSDSVCHQLLRAHCRDSFENRCPRTFILFLLPEGSVFDEIVFWSFFTLVNHDSIANRDRYRRLFLPFLTVFLLCFHQISIQNQSAKPSDAPKHDTSCWETNTIAWFA